MSDDKTAAVTDDTRLRLVDAAGDWLDEHEDDPDLDSLVDLLADAERRGLLKGLRLALDTCPHGALICQTCALRLDALRTKVGGK